jgi:hypothetical protein
MDVSSLVIGSTYYRLTFADRDLTMPGVEPLVYLGEVELSDGGKARAFQDTVSYVRFGSHIGASEGIDEMFVYFLPDREIGSDIVGIADVAVRVASAAKRAEQLGFPVLPVLRDGWRGAS